ncbi:MoxR family ATPase [Metallumcola ferriviriculae]|uniref:MoxR family ATPase n=1 Tax=Metallumcola ferriviriculae TaxID=3039180 RepID=A0AAU0UKU1_9FIRM|nr:MoxR family ATPase [Desulfitibacteraceae bacterium MK1]
MVEKETLWKHFTEEGYICDRRLITTVYLALRLEKPLLITGAPGVGKTEIAKVLSQVFDTELIRLQCYEGLDETKALYEWNYQKQLLRIQLSKADGSDKLAEDQLFSAEYLLERPLLKAIRMETKPVLLIDEIDKTDEEFEAFLFEMLSDFQVSIPEMGTITARQIPMVVLTSNAARELSDALKRRCIFLYIDYPSVEKELQIINSRVPDVPKKLAEEVAMAISFIRRELELKKPPAIAETLDWVRSLMALDADRLSPELIEDTQTVIFKNQEDVLNFEKHTGTEALYRYVRQS